MVIWQLPLKRRAEAGSAMVAERRRGVNEEAIPCLRKRRDPGVAT